MHYAAHLLEASGELYVHDRDRNKVAAAVSLGARAAGSSLELAELSETVVLALPDPDAVVEEMLGAHGVLGAGCAGRLVVDLSTIDPNTTRLMHGEATRRDCDYVISSEAPMSGGAPGGAGESGARAGTVTLMVGGDAQAVERARALLGVLGSQVIHVGPAGSGSTAKLVSNLIAGLNMAAMAEGFVLGAAAGLAPARLLEVFRHTDARSYTMFEEFAPHLLANDYDGGFAVDLMHKDHRLAAQLGERHDVPLRFNECALEAYDLGGPAPKPLGNLEKGAKTRRVDVGKLPQIHDHGAVVGLARGTDRAVECSRIGVVDSSAHLDQQDAVLPLRRNIHRLAP